MKKHGIEKNQMKKRFGQKCRRVLATRCTYWIPDAPTPAAFERFNVCAYEKRCSRQVPGSTRCDRIIGTQVLLLFYSAKHHSLTNK